MKARVVIVLMALLLAEVPALPQNNSGGSPKTQVHSVTLKWTPVAGATSYNVYRSTVSGGPYTQIGTALNTTYVDAPVPSGAVFYYVVTTVQNQKESSYSLEIKAVVP